MKLIYVINEDIVDIDFSTISMFYLGKTCLDKILFSKKVKR